MQSETSTSWNSIKAELLKDPEVLKEYNELEPEFEIIRQVIADRIERLKEDPIQ